MRTRIHFIFPILASLAVIAASPGAASAQRTDHRTVQRYNRVARGANVEEWHRRLFTGDVKTRLEALDSLGTSGGDEAVKPLLDATADEDARVRAKAIDYLGMLGNPQATHVLTQYLFLSDVDHNSKKRILVALGRIGDPDSIGQLTNFMTNIEDAELRCGALYALGEIGGATALPVIEPYLESEDAHEKRIATDAVAKINTQLALRDNDQPTIIQLERLLAPPPQSRR